MKQLKRLTRVLLVLGMVLGLMPLSAFAAEPESTEATTITVTERDNGGVDTYTFTLNGDGTAELKEFSTTAKAADAVIPSTVKEHLVTSIGTHAFYYRTALKSVQFEAPIKWIEDGAFSFCSGLEEVELPDSIISIGTGAFGFCTQLKTVKLGNSVVSIGENAFVYCTKLESVTIPSSVQMIGEHAFNFGYQSKKEKLEELHYTGTKAQWDKLAEENDFTNKNPMLKDPEKFYCAHTVSFDCGDQAKGSTQVVQYEGTVSRPADPEAQGYRFEGWYTQKNSDKTFDFNQKITEDVTVYAHWSKVETNPDPKPNPEPKPEPKPNPDPEPNPTPTPDPDTDTDTAKEYTLTEKDGTLVRVTVEKNGAAVDITKNVVLEQQGTTQIGKIPAGAMVTVAASAAPEGMVFAQWNISDPALMGDPDVAHTSQTVSFSMPAADVTVEAMYESAENARETELLGSAAMIGAVGISAVVLAYQAHQLGTELYLKYLLPSGAALPQNRIQLAELLWKNAGEPVPDGNARYEDIDLNDEAAQQAAQWALENELMELPDEEHTEQFKPDEQISYGEAIRAWKKAQQLKTAE